MSRFSRLFHQFDPSEQRLVAQSLIIGTLVWAIIYALKNGVHWLEHHLLTFLAEQPFGVAAATLLGTLTLGALFVAALARYGSQRVHYRDAHGHLHELVDVEGDGLERAISLYYASEPTFDRALLGEEGVDVRWKLPTFSLALRKIAATLATLGSGGSGGLEASVTLIGESVAAGLFKPRGVGLQGGARRMWHWWRSSDPDDLQTAQLSGIAAAVATLLGAPFAAAFFATEVMYRRRPIVEKLVYALIAALVAFFLNNIANTALAGEGFSRFSIGHLFDVDQIVLPPLGNWRYYVVLVTMCLLIASVSTQFSLLRTRLDDWFHGRFSNLWVRHLVGALLTGTIAILVWLVVATAAHYQLFGISPETSQHAWGLVLGTGEAVINQALDGRVVLAIALLALFAKMVATLCTISSGGSAGLLVPSLFLGTMIATLFIRLPLEMGWTQWTFSPVVLIVPAMTASLVSIVNVPLAAILFAVEVFSGWYMVPALITQVIVSIFTHQAPIYRTQRENYREREILPGYGVRRLPLPVEWDGYTVAQLDIRRRYHLNVIGWVEQTGEGGLPYVRLSADADKPLKYGDILVVLGQNSDLELFEELLASGNILYVATAADHPDPNSPTPISTEP